MSIYPYRVTWFSCEELSITNHWPNRTISKVGFSWRDDFKLMDTLILHYSNYLLILGISVGKEIDISSATVVSDFIILTSWSEHFPYKGCCPPLILTKAVRYLSSKECHYTHHNIHDSCVLSSLCEINSLLEGYRKCLGVVSTRINELY